MVIQYPLDLSGLYLIERQLSEGGRIYVEIFAPTEHQLNAKIKEYENRFSGNYNLEFHKPVQYPTYWTARIMRTVPKH